MKKLALNINLVFLFSLLLSSVAAAGELVVIVNKANDNVVNKNVVAKIYTGSMSSWPGGGRVMAIDLPEGNSLRTVFSQNIVGSSVSALKTLWSQNIFTGRAIPPKVVETDEDVVGIVAKNKNAIGYVNASSVKDGVKIAVK